MAQAFNLTAQLQLQAPGNVNQVVNQIRRQLKPIGIQVNIQNAKNLAQANSSLSSFNKNAQASTKSMNQLNRTLQESARRFSVITIATGSFLALANAFKNSVKEAVAFERELVKISQVTGKTVSQLSSLSNEVTRLSTSLGASSSDLLNVARTLTQAGFAADDTRRALEVLAQTSLGATFDNIQDTTEGAIALLRQFSDEARSTGGDVAFLEKSLSAISAVSKSFAVESSDLISAVRRTGGVFSAAGGSINELIALFTSVRATTRESAETIATGLRTIFTRIQRPETIDQLRQIGVELQDAQGNFVGAFEAFKRLSQGLKGLDPRSSAFSQIVEDLGGFRQVGKVIPLIQQFTTAQRALSVAQGASGTVAKDAETAQQSLGVQIQKTREQFDALIRRFVDSSAFRSLATGGLELAKAFIRIADSLEPLLPLLITLAGLKLGKGLAPALGSFVGIGKSVGGAGPVTKFASGGMVPGSGNRDTVPAMLTPGEFVIRKSSVKKLGAGTLAAMNENRFNRGARIKEELDQQRKTDVFDFKKGATIQAGKGGSGSLKAALSQADLKADVDPYQAVFLRPEAQGKQFNGEISNSNLKLAVKEAIEGTGIPKTQLGTANQIAERYAKRNKFTLSAGSLTSSESARLEGTLLDGVFETAKKGAKDINNSLGIQGEKNIATALRSANIDQVLGNLFEVVLSNAGAPFGMPDTDPPNAPFDFPSGLGNISKKFGLQQGIATEAKSFFSESNLATINKKIQNQLINESIDELRSIYRQNLTGGKEISLDEAKKAFGSTKLNRDDITRLAQAEGLDFTKVSGGKYTLTRRNAGGGISGSDTVPALLTPGEFVMNKSAAQSIGYTNLNRMNKQGVQGYAKGGAVGVKRFASGGKSSGGSGFSFGDMDAFSRSVSQSIGEVDLFSYAVSEAKNETELLAYALSELKEFGDVVAETSDKIEASADSSGVSGDSDKREKAEKKQATTINQTQKSLQGFQKGLAAVDKVAGAAQQFVFVGAAAGALVNEFTNASETTKTAINRTAGELASIVGIAGTVVQVFTSLASAAADRVSDLQEQASDNITIQAERAAQAATAQHTVALEADAAAMARHAAAVNADTVVEAKNSVVVEADTVVEASNTAAKAGGGLAGFGKLLTGLLNPLNLLLIGITALVAVFVYSKNKIKAENEALARSAKELADKFRETGEGLEQTRQAASASAEVSIRSQDAGRKAQLKELEEEEADQDVFIDPLLPRKIAELEAEIASLGSVESQIESFNRSLDQSLNSFKSLTDASNEQEEAFRRIGDSVFDAATKFQETINILDEYGKNFNAQVISDISKRIEESSSFERLAGEADPVTGFRPGTISSQQQLDEYLENPYAESVPIDIRSDVILLKQNLNELAKIQDAAAKNTDVSSRALNDALGRASSSADVDISEGSNTEVAQAYRKLRENINLESAARITQLRILQEIISDKTQKEAIDKQIREIENATAARAVAEEEYIAKVGKTIDIRNSNLKIQAEIKARQDNIESMNKLAEVTDRLSDLMARSRGEDPNDAGVINRNNLTRALQQEIRRNTAALDLSQRSFGLVNASLVGNLSALQARRSELVSAQSGIGKDDAEGLNENRQAIAAIDDEIKRIATDDSLTNSLFGAIEDNVKLIQKEQAARKQVIGVLEEFVVGGDEARNNLAEAAAGVRAAIATGSVQNQSEDQRKATFSLLDKLSDTIITFDRATGEGLTGSDVKERIIFQDAIRMGLDPEIARELATATSVEQQLIKSNEMLALQIQMLTFTMSQATLAMGANAAADAARGAAGIYTGGYIGSSGTLYRSGGGSIFKPKGTDTVPAMLTPGEFVIKKSAVDKIGVGTLQQINEGGGVVYRQNGSTNPEGYKKWLEKNKTTDSSYSRAAYDIEEERSFQEFMGEVDAQQILNNASDPSNTRTPTRGVVSRPGRLVHTGQGSGLYGAGYQEDERTRQFWERRNKPRGKAAVNYGEVGAFGDHSSMQKKDYHILGVPNRPKYPFHLEENQNQDAVQSPSDRTGITNRPSMFTGTTPTYKPQAPKKYERTGYTARRRERLTGRKTYSAEGYGTFTSEPTRTTSALNAGQTIKNYNAQKYGGFGGGFGGGRNQGMRFDPQMMQQMMMLMMLQQMMGGARGYAKGGPVYLSTGSVGPLTPLGLDYDPDEYDNNKFYKVAFEQQRDMSLAMIEGEEDANKLIASSTQRARDRSANKPGGLYGPGYQEKASTTEFWERRNRPDNVGQVLYGNHVLGGSSQAAKDRRRARIDSGFYEKANPLKQRQAARLQKKRDSLYGPQAQQQGQAEGMTSEKMMQFFMQMMMMQMMGGMRGYATGGIVQYRQYGGGIDPVDYEKWLKENDTTDGAFSRAAYKQQADLLGAQFKGEADAYDLIDSSDQRARDRQARAMQPAGLPNIEEDARTAEFWDRRENPMKYATDEARRTKGMSQADFNAEVQNKGGNAVILGSRTGTKGKRYNPLKERQAARLQKKRDSLYGADTQQPQTNQMQGMTPEKMMEFFMQMMMMQMMGGAMRFASGGIVQYRQYGEGIDPVDYEKWLKENDTTDGSFSRAAYKQQADMIAAQFQGEADAYNLIDTSDQRARDRQARAMQPAGLPNIEEDARTAEFWDRRENPMKYASAEAKRTKNMSQADFYAEAEANAQKSGRGGPNYSPVVLGSTLNNYFPSDPTEEDLKAIGAVKRGGAAARRRKRLTGKDTYSASGYGTRSFNVKKQEAEIKQRPPTAVQEDTTNSADLASRKPDFLSLGQYMRGKESTISSMDRRLITNNAATRTQQQTDNAIADEQDRANAVVEEQGRVRQFYAPDSNRTNKPSGNNTAPVESDGLHGSGQQMMQMMQMMMMMQMMGAQRGSRMMNDGRQRSRMGSGFLNFLGGGRRQQQQQYRSQMVPFGYIPGSPYNSMLGRGGYNIPMFDKRMLFGNGAAFFANGGAAAGGDTVPAMLTPGEFVMNKGAVSKYGTAFMRNLNKGKVQGFNKGGMVQYRQNGGEALGSSAAGPQAMGIDTSKIEGVFSSFVDNISSTFDNLISPLNGVVQSLNQIAQSFGNFTMQHTVNVEGLINVGGLNVETLKNELSSSIGEMVASEVTKVMDNQNKTFKSN